MTQTAVNPASTLTQDLAADTAVESGESLGNQAAARPATGSNLQLHPKIGTEAANGGSSAPALPVKNEPPLSGTIVAADDEVRPRAMIDVNRLRPRDGYVREDLHLTPGFVDSIRRFKVKKAILVVPDPERPDGFLIVDGVRTWAGACEAKLEKVPVELDPELVDNVGEQILASYLANAPEFTEAHNPFEQLALLTQAHEHGVDRRRLRQVTGRNATGLKEALKAGKQLKKPSPALTSMLSGVREEAPDVEWTVPEAILIAPFHGDEEALEMIRRYKLAGESIEYAIERVLAEQEKDRAREQLLAQLADAKVPVTETVPDSGLRLERLRVVDGEQDRQMTVEDHQDCPGHSAVIGRTYGGDPAAVYYCSDPRAHGHAYESSGTAEIMRLRAELAAVGRSSVERVPFGATRLEQLLQDGGPILPEQHHHCPGAGVAVVEYPEVQAVEYCTDPVANGHTVVKPEPVHTSSPTKKDEPPRKDIIEGNQAWAAAATVRRKWLASWLKNNTKAPKEVPTFLAKLVIDLPPVLQDALASSQSEQLFSTLTGRTTDKALGELDKISEGRRMLLALARVAAAFETQIVGDKKDPVRRYTWRTDRTNFHCSRETAGEYLALLANLGHQASRIELAVMTGQPFVPAGNGPRESFSDSPDEIDPDETRSEESGSAETEADLGDAPVSGQDPEDATTGTDPEDEGSAEADDAGSPARGAGDGSSTEVSADSGEMAVSGEADSEATHAAFDGASATRSVTARKATNLGEGMAA
ncbi:hypothetical protein AB0C84_42780 [Actinomadura sp. NPDC048955]|uniref:hypothetical protein n=1 Tax=Actinomadura sp. NPDC048955 TaxID=3158228 RepID=UPI0033D7704A